PVSTIAAFGIDMLHLLSGIRHGEEDSGTTRYIFSNNARKRRRSHDPRSPMVISSGAALPGAPRRFQPLSPRRSGDPLRSFSPVPGARPATSGFCGFER